MTYTKEIKFKIGVYMYYSEVAKAQGNIEAHEHFERKLKKLGVK